MSLFFCGVFLNEVNHFISYYTVVLINPIFSTLRRIKQSKNCHFSVGLEQELFFDCWRQQLHLLIMSAFLLSSVSAQPALNTMEWSFPHTFLKTFLFTPYKNWSHCVFKSAKLKKKSYYGGGVFLHSLGTAETAKCYPSGEEEENKEWMDPATYGEEQKKAQQIIQLWSSLGDRMWMRPLRYNMEHCPPVHKC